MISIVEQMRAALPDIPIMIQANAGLPEIRNGETFYPETPEQMQALIPDIIRAGATIIGGCCGTTPSHIASMKLAIKEL